MPTMEVFSALPTSPPCTIPFSLVYWARLSALPVACCKNSFTPFPHSAPHPSSHCIRRSGRPISLVELGSMGGGDHLDRTTWATPDPALVSRALSASRRREDSAARTVIEAHARPMMFRARLTCLFSRCERTSLDLIDPSRDTAAPCKRYRLCSLSRVAPGRCKPNELPPVASLGSNGDMWTQIALTNECVGAREERMHPRHTLRGGGKTY